LAAAPATASTLDVSGPSATAVRTFQDQQEGAQRVLEELLAHSAFPSIEELERDPWVRRRTERERTLHLKPDHDERERLRVLYVVPMMDYLSERAEHRRRFVAVAPGTGTKHDPPRSPISNRRTTLLDLERRFCQSTTNESMWIAVDEILEFWRRVKAAEARIDRREQLRVPEFQDRPKMASAADLILNSLSRGPRPWADVENTGLLAGCARKTLRDARDWLRDDKRIRRSICDAAWCWEIGRS
jgi:hypothetical protein